MSIASVTAQTEIAGLITSWAGAVREGDLAGIRAAHDPDVLLFDVPPPLQARGIESYMASWEKFLEWSVRPVVFELRDLDVVAGDRVAFATATGRCIGTGGSGDQQRCEFRLTIGLRKAADHWRIVHEHHSLPAT